MRRLIDEATWPEYLTTARVVPISKTDSAFPPVGSIRTVAVLPAVTKLMELLVMEELKKGARDSRLIAKEQQGFRKGVSTGLQVARLIGLMEKAKSAAQSQRKEKVPVSQRPAVHVAFLDLEKAYDRVDRAVLM